MKEALVTFIAKVEGVVKENFSRAPPQTPTFFAPSIKIPGGTSDEEEENLRKGGIEKLSDDHEYEVNAFRATSKSKFKICFSDTDLKIDNIVVSTLHKLT